jgi:predicted DNA-binding transcriptional regulator AlpA
MQTYTKKEVARILGVSTRTVDRMRLDNRLPAPLPRKSLDTVTAPWLWDKSVIDAIAEAN